MKKVLVGLSGGVDSAVAAWLLKEQGWDVTCAFMRNWDSVLNDDIAGNPTLQDPVCSQEADWADAQAAAACLGLPLQRVDFIEEYWQEVFSVFLSEYKKGRTPNPDILCNRYIKFDHFFSYAEDQGFDTVATGHYARMETIGGRSSICKARDLNKDQSYFLCQVHRSCLDHVLFPLGGLNKPEVRRIAERLHLSIAEKKDSTGICFIGERKFRQFLSNYLPMKPGPIVNINTLETIGTHQGVLYYTVGQRKGLDIGGTGPYFCIGKDVKKNVLYVTDAEHPAWLVSDACRVEQVNLLADISEDLDCAAKFRYRQPDCPVHLHQNEDGSVLLTYPQGIKAVTPGQEAVFYKGDQMLGGGVIETVYAHDEDLMEKICRAGLAAN
jgi:tRNA-specific 2-thiouridylase